MIHTKLSKVIILPKQWLTIILSSWTLLWMASGVVKAQNSSYDIDHKYTVQELKEDFNLVRRVLKEAHPGLFWYTSPQMFEQKFDSAYARLNQSMTEAEFYRFLSPLITLANCGHTVLDPSLDYQDQGKRFPIDLKFIKGKAYLLYNYSTNKALKMGVELLEINGQSMKKIVDQLLPMIGSDGENEIFKYSTLEEDFQNYYEIFIGKPDTFALKCRDTAGEILHMKVAASDDPLLRQYHKRSGLEMRTNPLQYTEIDSLQTAVMTINSFYPNDIKQGGQRFGRYLRRSFKKIHKHEIKNLIIDLRVNAGGEMLYANDLFSYLYNEPYMFLDRIEVATNKPLDFLKYTNWDKIDVHDNKYVDAQDSLAKEEVGNFTVKTNFYDFLEVQFPRRKRVFEGKVYILIGRKSYSATCLFSSLMYANERATFIGEETGGGAQGLNGGTFLDVTLPHTYLTLVVPLEKWVRIPQNYPHLKRGIIPQVKITPTIQDLIQGNDIVMKETLKRIAQRKLKQD
ncbi:MAG TPA: hypothetical protein DCS93_23265 [Microscillaceae bacterium]|nr:hypothetical protein [Microscillaceae bacterium]